MEVFSLPVWLQNELDEAYSGPIDGDPFRINHDCIQTLHELRTRGYKLGLISNTGRTSAITQRRRMKDAGILDFFETTVFSNEVGWRKPDRRIFSVAIEKLNATPGRIIHVGDNPYADIWGAKQMGMRAFQFKYDVPGRFAKNPNSLLALSRASVPTVTPSVKATARGSREIHVSRRRYTRGLDEARMGTEKRISHSETRQRRRIPG